MSEIGEKGENKEFSKMGSAEGTVFPYPAAEGTGLTNKEIDKLARNPRFLEVLVDTIIRDPRLLDSLVAEITDTEIFQKAVGREMDTRIED